MKTKITLLALLISGFMNAQSLAWTKQTSGGLVNGFHITTDVYGNVFTTGYFYGTVDFDPGLGVYNLNSTNPSAFVSKLDANGNFVWAVNVVSTGTTGGKSNGLYDIKTDQSGNVYIVGFFSGTCDFDPGQGVFSLTNYASTVYNNPFIWKLDAIGNLLWVKHPEESQYIYSIAIDASGNLLAAGSFTGTSDFNWGSGTSYLTSMGMADAFISKMDASGNFIDVKQIGGLNACSSIRTISTDAFSNTYAVGNFSGTIDADPGSSTQTLNAVSFQNFSLKLNNSGGLISAFSIDPPTGQSKISAVSHDIAGNTFVVGQYTGTCDFDPSAGVYTLQALPTGGFVYKLNPSGNFIWAKGIDLAVSMYTLKSDLGGNLYLSGFFNGSLDADPGPGIFTLNATGGSPFLCTLNSSGNFVSAIASTLLEETTLDMNGNIYSLHSASYDIYITKYASVYTGILENKKADLALNLSPNPGSGDFTLKREFESDCTVEIYNCSGQKIYDQTMAANSLSIDLKNCAAGVYLIRVSDKENMVWQKKLIKQ